MDTTSRYVTDLGSWDLPGTDGFEERLLDELINKTRAEVLRPAPSHRFENCTYGTLGKNG